MSPAEGAPEEFDQTIYVVDQNRSIGPVEGLALNLAKEAHRYVFVFITHVFPNIMLISSCNLVF